jgi:hypothetical protein
MSTLLTASTRANFWASPKRAGLVDVLGAAIHRIGFAKVVWRPSSQKRGCSPTRDF